MKKYYFFAALATVGLFASCSSDEDFSDAQDARQAVIVNDNAPAPIVINIDQLSSRGTGTVGGTGSANKWAGQTFNIYMFKKGTFDLATYKPSDTAPEEPIFENAVLTTPSDGSSSAATYNVASVPTFSYFPTQGAYSFWAYRVDDAGTGTAGVGEPKALKADGSDAASFTDAEATEVVVPFVIDGSQDLMVGVADTATAIAAAEAANGDASKVYTAWAARRNINPTLKFKHLLTRLYFNVIAASKDVSSEADAPVSGISGWKPGFEVTKITVKSKSEGEMVIAYNQPGADEDYNEATERVRWTSATEDWADVSTLATFELKSREKAVEEKAAVAFAGRTVGATGYTYLASYTYSDGTTGAATVAAGNVGFDGTEIFYDTDATDATTGLPTGTKYVGMAAVQAAGLTGTVYLLIVKDGYHTDGITADGDDATTVNVPFTKVTYASTDDASKPLVDLVHVTPGWNGRDAVAAADADYTTTDAYTVPAGVITTYATVAAYEAGMFGNNADGGATYYLSDTKEYRTLQWDGTATSVNNLLYTVPTSVEDVADATALANAAKALTATGDKVYYQTDATKYVTVNVTTAATAGSGAVENSAKTSVGEALLVAPADANGYEVEIFYTRTKKVNSSTVTPISGSVKKTIIRTADDGGGVAVATNFKAGKGYEINLKLYSDGEIKIDANDFSDLEEFKDDDQPGIEDVYDMED